MRRFVSATALMFVVAGCKAGSERNAVDTAPGAAPAAAPAPGGAMQPDTRGAVPQPMSPSSSQPRDTTTDTTRASAANQTQSGVTNAKTGKSTLGPGVKKTDPTQGQPVMSKGDTIAKPKKP
jgi:hypothetical protein